MSQARINRDVHQSGPTWARCPYMVLPATLVHAAIATRGSGSPYFFPSLGLAATGLNPSGPTCHTPTLVRTPLPQEARQAASRGRLQRQWQAVVQGSISPSSSSILPLPPPSSSCCPRSLSLSLSSPLSLVSPGEAHWVLGAALRPLTRGESWKQIFSHHIWRDPRASPQAPDTQFLRDGKCLWRQRLCCGEFVTQQRLIRHSCFPTAQSL